MALLNYFEVILMSNETVQNSQQKSKKEKFKRTKDLINIAITDGMTQEEIARICRCAQSIVSAWKNGKSKASVHQIGPLIKKYSDRLDKPSFRVYLERYLDFDASYNKWIETENYKKINEIIENLPYETTDKSSVILNKDNQKNYPGMFSLAQQILPGLDSISLSDLFWVDYGEFIRTQEEYKIVKVDGQIIFRHSFFKHVPKPQTQRIEIDKVPMNRWIIHQPEKGKFVLVRQYRRIINGKYWFLWKEYVMENHKKINQISKGKDCFYDLDIVKERLEMGKILLESNEDSVRWVSKISDPMELSKLLKTVDSLKIDYSIRGYAHDHMALPFLIRKALIEHGYPISSVDFNRQLDTIDLNNPEQTSEANG